MDRDRQDHFGFDDHTSLTYLLMMPDKDGYTCIHYCAMHDSIDVFQAIVEVFMDRVRQEQFGTDNRTLLIDLLIPSVANGL